MVETQWRTGGNNVSVAVKKPEQRRRHDERGAAVVEFAIASMVLLALLFGIISYGYALSFKQGLTQAAAEGARAAAVASAGPPAEAAAIGAVGPALGAFNKNCSSPGMSCTYLQTAAATGCGAASCIRVRISYDYKNFPLIPRLPGLGLLLPDTLTSTSIARVN
jgi:Flp pilus assembly protein TadG